MIDNPNYHLLPTCITAQQLLIRGRINKQIDLIIEAIEEGKDRIIIYVLEPELKNELISMGYNITSAQQDQNFFVKW